MKVLCISARASRGRASKPLLPASSAPASPRPGRWPARPISRPLQRPLQECGDREAGPTAALGDHPAPDVIASMTGKDTGFVLRYFVGLVAVKLGAKMKGFCVPVDEQ